MSRRVAIAFFLGCLVFSLPAVCATTVILARHAEKAPAPAADPPLSAIGRERAQLLASLLANAGVGAIFVTEYVRTQQTARPLAERLHLAPERVDAANTAKLIAAIRRHDGGTVLVIGHSNTVPAILSALGGPAVAVAENAFNDLFVCTISGQDVSLLRLRYGAGPAETASLRPPSNGVAMLEKRSPVMQIQFVRSGGFAGAATNVTGTVNFDESGAQVISEGTKYARELPPQEAEQLRTSADPAHLAEALNGPAAESSPVRDGYQYQISLATKDGKTHKLEVNADGSVKKISPELQALLAWVQQEAQKIWAHRITNR